ncbi:MAG TPA: hypothetical protein VHT75_07835 [Acidimicrobiales bacterium]|jgi:hypothetical protein|nr:hypothetical protein [Acidimicrobiales bacterium]
MPAFEAFARKAGVESPLRRELLWKDLYRAAHLDVFTGIEAAVPGFESGVPAMVRELSRIRTRAKEAGPTMRAVIEEIDPNVAEVLGVPIDPSPVHVVMVGAFTTNSAVGAVGDDVAVFHCVEWFQSVDGARVLVAHEAAHAWHRLALRRAGETVPPDDDLLWMIFSEGLATQASRAAAPNLAEVDYFWYGHPAMEDWVSWCEEHAGELRDLMAAAIDDPAAVERLFGAGFVDGRWRTGYHVADRLVASLGRTMPELVAMSVDEARRVVSDALGSH